MASIFQPFTSIPQHHQQQHYGHDDRSLYSQQFLDFNCNAIQFGGQAGLDLTKVDDTIGTWSTNYAILAIGLLGFFVFSCMKDPLVASSHRRFAFTSSYFGLTGLGYGVAGINHQISSLETDPKFYFVAYILTILGALALQLQIGMNWKASGNPKNWYNLLAILIGFAAVLVIAVWYIVIVVGAYLIVSNLWFVVYFGVIKDWLASAGAVFVVAGFLVQFFMAPSCGDRGYEDCFQDCILPDPMTFNHNALFHVLVIVGMLLHLFARFVPLEAFEQAGNRRRTVSKKEGDDVAVVESNNAVDEGDAEPNA